MTFDLRMKPKFRIIVFSISVCFKLCALGQESITLNFNPKDMEITTLPDGYSYIKMNNVNSELMEDPSLPRLPYMPITYRIDSGMELDSFTNSCDFETYKSNIKIPANPPCVSTSEKHEKYQNLPVTFNSTYPENNVIFVGTKHYGLYNVLMFLVTPWRYDSSLHTLDLASSIRIAISTKQRRNIKSNRTLLSPLADHGIFSLDEEQQQVSQGNPFSINSYLYSDFEYEIFTSPELFNTFNKLAKWKTKRGIPTTVVSISKNAGESNNDFIRRIKSRIAHDKEINNVKYILLGGDDSIIPSVYCYGKVPSTNGLVTTNRIPTDLYYACLGGNFDWDADRDGVRGELVDSVDFTQHLFVTRAPVRTVADAEAFVNKIIRYESNPSENGWGHNILMAGVNMSLSTENRPVSDAQMQGDSLYNHVIRPYWSGSRYELYDTYTSHLNGNRYDASGTNIQSELSKGYTFFEMLAHGDTCLWDGESEEYDTTFASSLVNNSPTIITTIACLTNAYDGSQPCLSEAFIRNPNSDIVAYLGCSREGWGNADGITFGSSLRFEESFYSKMFKERIKWNRFGQIVAEVKDSLSASCGYYGSMRWVLFGLNPIGDPEMPIFINTPQKFNRCEWSYSNSLLTLQINEDSCDVCVMDIANTGRTKYKVYRNVSSIQLTPTNIDLSVCVTKSGYVPRIFHLCGSTTYIQNEKIDDESYYSADIIRIGSDVTPLRESGPAVFDDCNVTLNANAVKLEPGTLIKRGASIKVTNTNE